MKSLRRSIHQSPSVRNVARDALADRARTRDSLPETLGPHAVVVYDQDRIRRTVDVLRKDSPHRQVIRGVRLANSDWGLRISPRFRTIKKDGKANATVGWIMYPPSDHSGLLANSLIRRPFSNRKHMSVAPIFFATSKADSQAETLSPLAFDESDADGTNPDVIGPNDDYVGSTYGQFIIFKANGDLVLRAPGTIYAYGADQDVGDTAAASRAGDSGADGGIGGGSGRVRLS